MPIKRLDGGRDRSTVDAIIAGDPERFSWDHILIDEAQDWTDDERDLIQAVYGHRRLLLVDGLAQLVRRQVPCDWLRGVPNDERETRYLENSLRMTYNVTLFANAFSQTVGFADWRVEPNPALAGGRVVFIEGALEERLPLVLALGDAAAAANARPVDNLICVPHTEVEKLGNGARRSLVAAEGAAAGLLFWDACDPSMRGVAPEGMGAWRVVQYDSCRGLRGWAVLLLSLDELYANKIRYPNLHEGDKLVDAELVARRWLLIPLTRAVHLLVVHVRDPDSPVASLLKEAAALMPPGVVERYAAAEGPAGIASLGSPGSY